MKEKTINIEDIRNHVKNIYKDVEAIKREQSVTINRDSGKSIFEEETSLHRNISASNKGINRDG